MSVERDIRYELLARLCPNTTGKRCCNLLLQVVLSSTLLLQLHVPFILLLYFALFYSMFHISVLITSFSSVL